MPELTFLIDSKLGRNRSADGASSTYPLEPALMVPFDAEPTLRVLEANVFYTSPNVSAAKSNNKLKFSVITSGTVANNDLSTADHTITFDDGLYSLSLTSTRKLRVIWKANRPLQMLLFRLWVTGRLKLWLRTGTRRPRRTELSSVFLTPIRSHHF